MKKELMLKIVLSILLLVLLVFSMLFSQEKKEKINVYLFWGDGCPHCEHAKDFFSNNSEYSRYYNLIDYEVWYNSDNRELMSKIANEFEVSGNGVPFIVIGDKYFSGYSSRLDSEINEAIVTCYENKDCVDMIEKVK